MSSSNIFGYSFTSLFESPSANSEQNSSTVSYQELITKINDINIRNKDNHRVKEIIKEYTYNASDDDSKNSAREKALNQVKVIILEEIGVFVESYLELNKAGTDQKYQKQFRQEIKNFTAGISKTQIIDEKFDGRTYYVKASIMVDPDSVSEGISEILKIKAGQSEIKKLNELLENKEKEIDIRSDEVIGLQKKLTSQELLNRAKEDELKVAKTELELAKAKLQKYETDEQRLKGELIDIQKKVNQAMQRMKDESKKACLIKEGMTKRDVLETIGLPSTQESSYGGTCTYGLYMDSCRTWYYGSTEIEFSRIGLVSDINGCR